LDRQGCSFFQNGLVVCTVALSAAGYFSYPALAEPNPYHYGYYGCEVNFIQEAVGISRRYDPKQKYDLATAAAIVKFQSKNGLPIHGVATQDTLKHLGVKLGKNICKLVYDGSSRSPDTVNRYNVPRLRTRDGIVYYDQQPYFYNVSSEPNFADPNQNISFAMPAQQEGFVVAILGDNITLLNQVRRYFPTAFPARTRQGAFVNVGRFSDFNLAESRRRKLENLGFRNTKLLNTKLLNLP
jgi:Putative peptidoglycan binding domain